MERKAYLIRSSESQGLPVNYINNEKILLEKENLNEIKKFVLRVVDDLIAEEKLDQLYPLELYCITKNQSDFGESELFTNISELFEDKWIIPGEKMTKDGVLKILEHDQIYKYIIENPGCDTSHIMRDLGISFRYALKNLETLFKFGFIRARKYSQYFLYFPFSMPEEEDLLYCLARRGTNRKILKYLVEKNDVATVEEIAKAIYTRKSAVVRYLGQLTEANLVLYIQDKNKIKANLKEIDLDAFEKLLDRYKSVPV